MYKLDVAYQSNKGGREHNQDYIAYCKNGADSCLVACDGLGSYSGSEIISQVCAETLTKLFKADVDAGLINTYEVEHCRENVIATQRAIIDVKQRLPELKSACTTMACVVTNLNKSFLVHIGDTRIYLFRRGKLLFQTRDHSLAQYAVDRGEIRQGEVRSHRDQNKLTRVMGSDYYIPPDIDIYNEPLEEGDAFVLCTDGYWEYVFERELEELMRTTLTAEQILEETIKLVNERAPQNNDNFSVIVARVVDETKPKPKVLVDDVPEVVISSDIVSDPDSSPTVTKDALRNREQQAKNNLQMSFHAESSEEDFDDSFDGSIIN